MKINAQPMWLQDLKPHALNSLSVNNRRLEDGSNDILVNPAMDSISDEAIINSLWDIVNSTPDDVITDTLRKIEEDNQSKFGPRSIAIPWGERRNSLFDYFKPKDDIEYQVPGKRGNGTFRAISPSNASKSLIRSSSAGLPYMTRKGTALDEETVIDLIAEAGKYPCVLFTRTSEQKKTRNIWGYPISDTLREQQLYQVYLPIEQQLPWRKAVVTPDAVDMAVSLMLLGKSDEEIVYSVDFTAYDASISPALSHAAFDFIGTYFQPSDRDLIDLIADRFVNIPIMTPRGEIIGTHGVPSGSTFTNAVDSLVQRFAANDFAYDKRYQIQGDDGIYIIKSSDREPLEKAFDDYGLKINTDKAAVFSTKEGIYLQKYYSSAYMKHGYMRGVYSIFRAMNRIKYLESWTDFEKLGIEGSDFFSIRTITILENCKHHPCFHKLVKYVYNLDKKNLAFSQGGLSAYSRGMKSKAKAGISNQYGDLMGISNFETVKLIQKF
jgi:hypothetical protein